MLGEESDAVQATRFVLHLQYNVFATTTFLSLHSLWEIFTYGCDSRVSFGRTFGRIVCVCIHRGEDS